MFQLDEALAKLTNLNLRTEKVGRDNHRPAADLKFEVDLPNTMLETIEPGLLRALYKGEKEQGHQGDLVAAPEQLTTLRFPKAKPFQLTEDWPGYFAGISAGEFDVKDVELDKLTVKAIAIEAKTGGTVTVSFSAGCHPTPEDVAILYQLMGNEVELTLEPPSLEEMRALREEAKKKTAAQGGTEPIADPNQAALPMGADAPAGRAFSDAIDGRGDRPPSTRTPAAPKEKAPAKGASKASTSKPAKKAATKSAAKPKGTSATAVH